MTCADPDDSDDSDDPDDPADEPEPPERVILALDPDEVSNAGLARPHRRRRHSRPGDDHHRRHRVRRGPVPRPRRRRQPRSLRGAARRPARRRDRRLGHRGLHVHGGGLPGPRHRGPRLHRRVGHRDLHVRSGNGGRGHPVDPGERGRGHRDRARLGAVLCEAEQPRRQRPDRPGGGGGHHQELHRGAVHRLRDRPGQPGRGPDADRPPDPVGGVHPHRDGGVGHPPGRRCDGPRRGLRPGLRHRDVPAGRHQGGRGGVGAGRHPRRAGREVRRLPGQSQRSQPLPHDQHELCARRRHRHPRRHRRRGGQRPPGDHRPAARGRPPHRQPRLDQRRRRHGHRRQVRLLVAAQRRRRQRQRRRGPRLRRHRRRPRRRSRPVGRHRRRRPPVPPRRRRRGRVHQDPGRLHRRRRQCRVADQRGGGARPAAAGAADRDLPGCARLPRRRGVHLRGALQRVAGHERLAVVQRRAGPPGPARALR